MTNLNNDTRELNINELDAVSGGSLTGWMHTIVDTALQAVTPKAGSGSIWDGTGMGSGGINSGSGSGSGTPVCPGCHSPA
jgi:bacteriocin-like protein